MVDTDMNDGDDESFDSDLYSRLQDQLDEIFPNCPFVIDCIKSLVWIGYSVQRGVGDIYLWWSG
jgi:hypothetical protein